MSSDLISRAAAIKAVEKRERYLVGDKRIHVDSIKKFLSNRPSVDATEIVRCRDCVFRGNNIRCPMCFDEIAWDEDDGNDYYTVDRTVDHGYCHCGSKEYESERDE